MPTIGDQPGNTNQHVGESIIVPSTSRKTGLELAVFAVHNKNKYSSLFFLLMQHLNETSARNLIENANKIFKFSQLDAFASSVFMALNIFSWIFYFFAFKFQVKHLNKFCKEVEAFNKENEVFSKNSISIKGNHFFCFLRILFCSHCIMKGHIKDYLLFNLLFSFKNGPKGYS
jgi:hypothetical protein